MTNYELDVVVDKGKVSKELVDKYRLNDEVAKTIMVMFRGLWELSVKMIKF